MEGTLSGGKKWASGTSTLSSSNTTFSYTGTTGTTNKFYIDIALNFTPSTILVSAKGTNIEYLSVLNNMGQVYSKSNVKTGTYSDSAHNMTSASFKNNSYVSLGNNVYRVPIHNNAASNITWIAYE